jgi:hypothetical protein
MTTRVINASNLVYAPTCATSTDFSPTVSGTGLYDRAVNWLFKANLKDGEKHGILKTKDGWKPASYMGPGTKIAENIRNNVEPLTEVDRVAQAHDLRYAFAQNADDVRDADTRMVNKVKQIKKAKSDSRWNTAQADLIRAKIWLENKGLVKRDTFASYGFDPDTTKADKELMRAKLGELTALGYGVKTKK